MKRPAVRLIDVADAAQTSIKTASRVINGDVRVAAETRLRVENAVKDLGYQVDLLARSLRRGVDDAVGVVVQKIGDPFFAAAIEEIERVAYDRGIQVIVASTHGDETRERDLVVGLRQRRVAGMIITPNATDFSFLASSSTPVVFFDRVPRNLDADVVLVGDREGGRMAVRHLLKHGHARVAVVADSIHIDTSRNRYYGYLDALDEVGIAIDDLLIRTDCADIKDAEEATHVLLDLPDPPTAIFSCRAETSFGVVKVMHRRFRTDIALVSFDDFEMADTISPAITVLDHSARVLGRLAIEKLFSRMDGDTSPKVHTIPKLQIIERGSGEIFLQGAS